MEKTLEFSSTVKQSKQESEKVKSKTQSRRWGNQWVMGLPHAHMGHTFLEIIHTNRGSKTVYQQRNFGHIGARTHLPDALSAAQPTAQKH